VTPTAEDTDGSRFRALALSQVDPAAQPLPQHPTVAFVWPTELCGIGCAHCNYGSVRTGPPERNQLAQHPEELVHWLVNAGASRFVACGGGEPLNEPEFLERSIAACASAGMPFAIYTGGVASETPLPVAEYVRRWVAATSMKGPHPQPLTIRLSVDRFHEERVGLEPLVDWVREVERLAPTWTITLRSLRLINDGSVERLAARLGGILTRHNERDGTLQLPSGREIEVVWKGFVFERRGRAKLLTDRGMSLTEADLALTTGLEHVHGTEADLGRPLSAELAIAKNRVNLEIHADCSVHIVEAQAPDLRLNFTEWSWEAMRERYFRDPILHCVSEGGLPAIARIVSESVRTGAVRKGAVPYSIEQLTDPALLDLATAVAILENGDRFRYSDELKEMAAKFVKARACGHR